jgi:hypothetical protein
MNFKPRGEVTDYSVGMCLKWLWTYKTGPSTGGVGSHMCELWKSGACFKVEKERVVCLEIGIFYLRVYYEHFIYP